MPEIFVISGATATGKSELALALAEEIGGEIVSADSMQLYRELSVGVAKPSPEERARVPHHLIDVASFHDRMDVCRYVDLAEKAVAEILSRGRTPVVCGGTGFYIKALLFGLDDLPGDDALRQRLDGMEEGEFLDFAAATDPAAFEKWRGCRRKLVRAIEVKLLSGRSLLELQSNSRRARYRSVGHFCIDRAPEDLKNRIRVRAEKMLASGWIEEAERCLDDGLLSSPTAHQAIGYRLIGEYLAGRLSREELPEKIATSTWQFARRQRTWFAHQHPEAVRVAVAPGEKAPLSAVRSFPA